MAKEPRILIVSQHYWPESLRLNGIADYLNGRGCKVDVLCGIPNYPKGQFFKDYSYFRNRHQHHNGISITRAFEIPRHDNSYPFIFLNYVSFPIASLFHIPKLMTKKYDKIFLYQTSPVMMSIAGIVIGKLKRVETTMYVLDLWPENLFSVLKLKNNYVRAIVTRISHWHYKKVDKFIVLSEMMKQKLKDVTKLPDNKITIIPLASEKVYENNIYDKTLSNKYKAGFNIVFAGNISPAQSFETILAAATILKKDGIKDINWIIVGDGMSKKWLESEVQKLKLGRDFHFEGLKPINDIPKYTEVADLLIGCLVKSELLEATIPSKVMSYLAAGKPIVLAMDGEVQDLINNIIRCGYASPTEDSSALANNIKRIYSLSAKGRHEMGMRGRNYHLKNFERSIVLDKLYKFVFS